MTDELRIGLSATIDELRRVRDELGIESLTARWTTSHGHVDVALDADGWTMFVAGEPVAQGDRP